MPILEEIDILRYISQTTLSLKMLIHISKQQEPYQILLHLYRVLYFIIFTYPPSDLY